MADPTLAAAVLAGIVPPPALLTNDGLLDIGTCKFVAEGRSRAVYEHPTGKDLLIKVMLPRYVEAHGTGARGLRRRLANRWRKFGAYAVFHREMRETIHASRAVHPRFDFAMPFARCYGFVWTNQGIGQVVERIGSADGSLAPTLRRLLKDGHFAAEHEAALEEFFRICGEYGLVAGGLHAHNIVYQDSQRRFVCIDGYGDKNMIPVHEMSRVLNGLKLKRTRNQLFQTIGKLSTKAAAAAAH